MPDKINIIFGYTNFQELKNRIQELIAGYAQMLKQPAKKEDKLLIEDVPKIGVKPKSIGENQENTEEKRPKNIGRFSNIAYDKDSKMIEHGGTI